MFTLRFFRHPRRLAACITIVLAGWPVLLRADVTVPTTTVTAGENLQIANPGAVTTLGNTIDVQPGGKAAFIGGSSVTLSPGFHAASGALFHATRDLNLANLASLTDTDLDGLPDEWELLHFGNLTTVSGIGDYDGDGVSNAMEYYLGTNPAVNESTGNLGGFQVVIRMPNGKYEGIDGYWDIGPAP